MMTAQSVRNGKTAKAIDTVLRTAIRSMVSMAARMCDIDMIHYNMTSGAVHAV